MVLKGKHLAGPLQSQGVDNLSILGRKLQARLINLLYFRQVILPEHGTEYPLRY